MSVENYHKELIKLNVLNNLKVLETSFFVGLGLTALGSAISYGLLKYGVNLASLSDNLASTVGWLGSAMTLVFAGSNLTHLKYIPEEFNRFKKEGGIEEKIKELKTINTEANKLINGFNFNAGTNILIYHFRDLLKENLSAENIEKAIEKINPMDNIYYLLNTICKSDKKICNQNLENILGKIDINTIAYSVFESSNKDIQKQIISIIAKDEIRLEDFKIKIEKFKIEGMTNEELTTPVKQRMLKTVIEIEKMISEVGIFTEERKVINPMERMTEMRNKFSSINSSNLKKII